MAGTEVEMAPLGSCDWKTHIRLKMVPRKQVFIVISYTFIGRCGDSKITKIRTRNFNGIH